MRGAVSTVTATGMTIATAASTGRAMIARVRIARVRIGHATTLMRRLPMSAACPLS
jgi:hypothetical protein